MIRFAIQNGPQKDLQTYISLVANVALALQRSIADNSWPREFDAFTDLGATRTSQRSQRNSVLKT